MNKHLGTVLAGVAALMTVNAIAAPPAPTDKITPHKNTTTIKQPLTKGCPDPGVNLSMGNISKNRDGSYNFYLWVYLKNEGRAAYQSMPNQQTVTLNENGSDHALRIHNFRNLAPGQVERFFHEIRNYSMSREFFTGYNTKITYDPDIRIDNNKTNDDCNSRNNTAGLTREQIELQLNPPQIKNLPKTKKLIPNKFTPK